MKIGAVYKDKIEMVGGIMAHTQSVNSICSLEASNGVIATGSADKSVRIWQPTSETVTYLQS